MTIRTVTSIRAQAVQPRSGVSALLSLFLDLQDYTFEALAELRYGLDRLRKAGWYDDQETAIEQGVFRAMQACGCPCCRVHLPRLLRADHFDRQERTDGYEPAVVRIDNGAAYIRGASTQIEAGRAQLAGYRRGGPDGGAA